MKINKKLATINILTTALVLGASLICSASAPADPSVSWENETWNIKNSNTLTGAGPNYWSSNNVSIQPDGLHLKLTMTNNKWYAAGVYTDNIFGYGDYTWQLTSPSLDPSVTLGVFTWNDDPAYNHREIDFEISKFGNGSLTTNAQLTTEPYSGAHQDKRITLQPGQSTVTIAWRQNSITWTVVNNGITQTWNYTGTYIPAPTTSVRMNLWPLIKSGPQDGQPTEAVINSFDFVASQ